LRAIYAIVILALLFNAACSPVTHGSGSTAPVRSDMRGTFPVYGNWCGPDHPKLLAGNEPPPIDSIDAACMRHDKCYAENTYFSCSCDVKLWSELRTNPHPTAKAITYYFGTTPCLGPDLLLKPVTAATSLTTDLTDDPKLGAALTFPFIVVWGLVSFPLWLLDGSVKMRFD
jgi:hypothetical protein